MSCLIDTSILGRLANTKDLSHSVAANAILNMRLKEEMMFISPQNLIEFRNVATRPISVNGLGLSASDAEKLSTAFENQFLLLEENSSIFTAGKNLVFEAGVIGKQVHDARLVAVCQVYGINSILTFNVGHFARLASFVSNLDIIDPASLK